MRMLVLPVLVAVTLLPACESRPAPVPSPGEVRVVTAPPLPESPPRPESPLELTRTSVSGMKMPSVW